MKAALKKLSTVTSVEFSGLSLMLERKGVMEFPVVSGSMEPVIMTDSKIEVTRPREPIKKFDIIVFWNKSILICHYVWHINKMLSHDGQQVFVTRALNGGGEDLPCVSGQILGLVTSHSLSQFVRLKLRTKYLLGRRFR